MLRANPILWLLSFLSSYRFAASALLERLDVPLLVVHGDRDEIVPFAAGRAVYERAPASRKTFLAIPGASHNDLHVVNPQQYWHSLDQFLASLASR